jgi:YVTN family beta-propeller protein
MREWFLAWAAVCAGAAGMAFGQERVGTGADGSATLPTAQRVRAAGQSVQYHGRPVDVVLSPDAKTLYVKSDTSLLAVDAATWAIRQNLDAPAGASMHGLAVSADGKNVFYTGIKSTLAVAEVGPDGRLKWGRTIPLRGKGATDSYPCGIALSADGNRAWVCLSMANTLAEVDLVAGKVVREIPVGVAPYGVVLSKDGKTAWVSNWGGRRPINGDRTGKSAGTDTVVDARGVASTGTVSLVHLAAGKEIAQIATGLHPADVELSKDGARLYVANANSDTVSVIDTAKRAIAETIPVRPDPKLPFGSSSNALALSDDGRRLFVANGGNNAVAVVRLGDNGRPTAIEGFVPTGWWPGAVAVSGNNVFIANTKGVGSRDPKAAGRWNSYSYWGTVTKVDVPAPGDELTRWTQQVKADARVPQSLRAWEKAQAGAKPVPVPERVGEPSPIEHVVYVIKENRTYDQVLGDIGKGNSDPGLCIFGRNVTPNHHALAEQFVLLDNYYCNAVLSSDGHAWATEGYAGDYLQKSFGGWARSYPFPENDALAWVPTGFIWDQALLHGVSFRNYGEFVSTKREPDATCTQVMNDYRQKAGKIRVVNTLEMESLKNYTCMDFPGWDMAVPDMIRADVFIKELAQYEKTGDWPNLIIVYLPQDHTSGTQEGAPTPEAHVAENDLALGRVVEAITKSKFWPKTCVFVVEDDPQSGFDHVDGHRSLCLVVSPYAKRNAVVSDFYSQTSVLRTMELMLGMPPMNQMDAMAPAMTNCFTPTPDLAPYTCLPNNIPIDQDNPKKAALNGKQLEMARVSDRQDLSRPDAVNDDEMNRVLWHATRGWQTPYPAQWAGAHGRGLKRLGLKLDPHVKDDDDD